MRCLHIQAGKLIILFCFVWFRVIRLFRKFLIMMIFCSFVFRCFQSFRAVCLHTHLMSSHFVFLLVCVLVLLLLFSLFCLWVFFFFVVTVSSLSFSSLSRNAHNHQVRGKSKHSTSRSSLSATQPRRNFSLVFSYFSLSHVLSSNQIHSISCSHSMQERQPPLAG